MDRMQSTGEKIAIRFHISNTGAGGAVCAVFFDLTYFFSTINKPTFTRGTMES